MIFVTDTHPLVYWSSKRRARLGRRARRIFEETERGKHAIVVPITVLEETNRLVERHVIQLDRPFVRWAEDLEHSPNYRVHPFTFEVLRVSVGLIAIRDPADRLIVAVAKFLQSPLITADEIIQDGNWIDTVWE